MPQHTAYGMLLAVSAMFVIPTMAAAQQPLSQMQGVGADPKLPPPKVVEVVNYPNYAGWPEGKTPKVPNGFSIHRYQSALDHPRWMYVLPNNDVLVAESHTTPPDPEDQKPLSHVKERRQARAFGHSANRITLLRDTDGDGLPDYRSVLLRSLKQPFGMAYKDGYFYVANTDSVERYEFKPGQTSIDGAGLTIVQLPAGGYNHHWTRNLLLSKDGSRFYISVGSASNNGEYGLDEEKRRANILTVDLDGKNEEIYASGLRNPVGMDFNPVTGELWTAVNERDNMGENLVPDYITSVKKGGFYGWPFAYFGSNPDPMYEGKHPEMVAKAIKPDYALGSHTASLGLAFYDPQSVSGSSVFPEKYHDGAFIGQHGSWNRERFSGYAVAFVRFENGKPTGKPEFFVSGFLKEDENKRVFGRPCGVTVLGDGSLLIADDLGDTIWRVTAKRDAQA